MKDLLAACGMVVLLGLAGLGFVDFIVQPALEMKRRVEKVPEMENQLLRQQDQIHELQRKVNQNDPD